MMPVPLFSFVSHLFASALQQQEGQRLQARAQQAEAQARAQAQQQAQQQAQAHAQQQAQQQQQQQNAVRSPAIAVAVILRPKTSPTPGGRRPSRLNSYSVGPDALASGA